MHRYTSAQARGPRAPSPTHERQRAAMRDLLAQTAARGIDTNTLESSAVPCGTQATHHNLPHHSPSVYVDMYGSPTTIPAHLQRGTPSVTSPWNLAPPTATTTAPQRQALTITAPSATSPHTARHASAATAPLPTPYTVSSWRPGANQPSSGNASASSPPSVKHLTCYFWDKYGRCKWSDEECLYAHFQTGKVAGGPVQVEMGRPAVAGKNASAPKPVYESWRNLAFPSSSTSPTSPPQLTPASHDLTTPPRTLLNQPFQSSPENASTAAYFTASTSPSISGTVGLQTQNPIGIPKTSESVGVREKYSAAAEELYYAQQNQIATLIASISSLSACLGSSHSTISACKDTLSEEGAALVGAMREMQQREGGTGGGYMRGEGASAGGRVGGGGVIGGRQGGSSRLLETVQKLCDVIDAQRKVVQEMEESKGVVEGMLVGCGLDGVGIVEAEGMWDVDED